MEKVKKRKTVKDFIINKSLQLAQRLPIAIASPYDTPVPLGLRLLSIVERACSYDLALNPPHVALWDGATPLQ